MTSAPTDARGRRAPVAACLLADAQLQPQVALLGAQAAHPPRGGQVGDMCAQLQASDALEDAIADATGLEEPDVCDRLGPLVGALKTAASKRRAFDAATPEAGLSWPPMGRNRLIARLRHTLPRRSLIPGRIVIIPCGRGSTMVSPKMMRHGGASDNYVFSFRDALSRKPGPHRAGRQVAFVAARSARCY